jgi:hypothetical protein
MNNRMALAIVLFAAMAAVALRAAARRPQPRRVPGTEPEPVTGTADQGPPGQPTSAVEQMQRVFHELHADGRNALCTVCDDQYAAA